MQASRIIPGTCFALTVSAVCGAAPAPEKWPARPINMKCSDGRHPGAGQDPF
ncbi:MAG: hypothetical protein JWM26_275 [Betaproteobacteria bacterium]|nr:hypothetical protein [Betaproteobacteria bacterium]